MGDLILVVDEELANRLTIYNRLIPREISIFGVPLVAIFTGIGLVAFALWVAIKAGEWMS